MNCSKKACMHKKPPAHVTRSKNRRECKFVSTRKLNMLFVIVLMINSVFGLETRVEALTQLVDQDVDCKIFVDNNNNEFFSPNYPEEYPDNKDCIKVISADQGHVIRLRFLDNFHLEPDSPECRYDYLEIRDGQFGYSAIIGKLCGTTPPPYIESSGRHLWIRFHTDKDIHHIGFRATFEFVPTPLARPDLDDCSFHVTDLDGYVQVEELSPEILINRKELGIQTLDCTWVIEAPENQKIYLQFKEFVLEKANDCSYNFVEVYGSRTEVEGVEGRMQQFCGSTTKTMTSVSNKMHFRFYTHLTNDNSEIGINFKTKMDAYYSLFRELAKQESKDAEPDRCKEPAEFDCTDNTCIATNLVCNQETNCKLRIDEDKTRCNVKTSAFQMTMDLVVIAFIGCFLAAGMCSGLVLNICRKLRQDKLELEEIRASMRKSGESMTRKSAADLKEVLVEEDAPKTEGESLKNSSSTESKETVIYKQPLESMGWKTPVAIPYSPPPPYNPKKKEEVTVIEVRDSACQTRESFTESYLKDMKRQKRAPLAKTEAVDDYYNPNIRKKHHLFAKSPSSVTSVDASTGSLELLQEIEELTM